MRAFETLADGFVLVEGPRPDGEGGVLFSDVVGGGVRRWSPGGIEVVVPGRRGVGGLVLHADGAPVVAGRDLAHGERTVLAAPDGVTGFNDLATTDDGGVLAGALRFRPMAGDAPVPGELWLVPPAAAGAEPRILADGIVWPNGIGLSPAGDVLYVSDFSTGEVLAFDPDGGGRRLLARAPGGAPDGLAVDAEGGVWVALGPAGKVARLAADGTLDALLDVRRSSSRAWPSTARTCWSPPRARCCGRRPAWPAVPSRQRPSDARPPTTRLGCPRSAVGRGAARRRRRLARRGPAAPPTRR